ncbi:MAG TPA: MarR family transcriptional regulator [Devosia sp.]|jgi:DNA-binding MarR family transcriptional regulator|nr:MarR family transcriptional regulator [Devosia sp.]
MKSKSIEPVDQLASPLELYMRAMFTHLLAAMARSLSTQDMSLRQLAALHVLDQKQEMRIGELAEVLALPLPSASRLASEMVQRGMFIREEVATDRRAKVLRLSQAGRQLIDAISRQRVDEGNVALAAIGGEVGEMFNRVFDEMRSRGLSSVSGGDPAGDAKRKEP